MTQAFRYRRLGYVALNVTDLPRALDFYQTVVGLQPAGRAGDEHFLRCSDHHHDVVLHEAPQAGLRRVGWEMASAEDLEMLVTHLTRAGLRPVALAEEQCAALGLGAAVRVVEPHTGAIFEYFVAMAAAVAAFSPTVAKIARLGHVVLQTEDHAATERFFLDTLNFRASDRIESAVTFMRCFPNPLHHSFGLSNGPGPRLHHVNFMVTDIDDIGRALYRLQRHAAPIVFGPGRHPPSESVFLYFLDPDGLTLEYSFGMEEFPEVAPREPRLLPKALSSIDHWGAVPDPGFAARGVIETLAVAAP